MDYRIVLNIALFLIFTTFFGCRKDAVVEVKDNIIFKITPGDFGIDNVKVKSWKVGENFAQEVSRGVVITMSLPIVDDDDLSKIFVVRKATSWIIRIKRTGNFGDEVVGILSIPFVHFKKGEMKIGGLSKITFEILYAASSISERLSDLRCPAFNHNKRIEETDVTTEPNELSLIVVSPSEERNLSEKVENFSYGYITFNGGNDLSGEYKFELAMYDLNKKQLKSNWVNVANHVKVYQEKEVDIRGCAFDSVPVYSEKDLDKMKNKFKFGK